jgi:predicted nuclease of restriction endonuclease-like (RecB) superfamily
MDLELHFIEVVRLIQQARSNAYKAVNVELVNLYWQVGEYISKKVATASWGDKTVDQLAEYLQKHYPDLKGYNRRGLYRMKQFYETYAASNFVSPLATQIQVSGNQNDTIVSPLETQLGQTDIRNTVLAKISWSHHLVILSRTKTPEEREFYIRLCIKEGYSKRELDRQISSGVFERVMIGNQNLPATVRQTHADIANTFKDSYVFEFLNLDDQHSEGDLQKALITQLKSFVVELGKDFLFVGEEHKVQVGNSDFFIDLLFYHRGLQCLICFELKADKFKPEHLGQLNFYLEALDRDVKKENEKPSIGVLLCKDKDTAVVEYALSRNLSPALVAEYQMQLPDKNLLQRKVNEIFRQTENA